MGWSSPVARQTHNLEAEGSNPSPTTLTPRLGVMQPKKATSTRRDNIELNRPMCGAGSTVLLIREFTGVRFPLSVLGFRSYRR